MRGHKIVTYTCVCVFFLFRFAQRLNTIRVTIVLGNNTHLPYRLVCVNATTRVMSTALGPCSSSCPCCRVIHALYAYIACRFLLTKIIISLSSSSSSSSSQRCCVQHVIILFMLYVSSCVVERKKIAVTTANGLVPPRLHTQETLCYYMYVRTWTL